MSTLFYRDLYGAIGFPLRVAKTVVVGKHAKLVEQVLNILSYFIRCTEVSEHVQKRDEGSAHNIVSSLGEESGCSQCGRKPFAEVENPDKSCSLTSEKGMCLKCKQKCDEISEMKDKEDKEYLREQILKQLHVNGITHCAVCGSRNSSTLEKLHGIEMSGCTCNSISNGGIRKELKHFIKDTNLPSQSFHCYCCNDPSDVNGILSKTTKCKCFSDSVCDSGIHQGKEDSIEQILSKENHHVNCLEKLLVPQTCNVDSSNQANNCLRKLAKAVQSSDALGNSNGHVDSHISDRHMDSHISETDSCLSDDMDTSSCRSSLPERCSDVDETIASYGRSGSADSGIHQSPLNSPSAQRPVEFPKVTVHQGEEKQIPEELSLPEVVNVNCCPDPER